MSPLVAVCAILVIANLWLALFATLSQVPEFEPAEVPVWRRRLSQAVWATLACMAGLFWWLWLRALERLERHGLYRPDLEGR